ncbi:MAG: enoyl-CoA hydratase/isomerase family protein [Paracoccus sp. (in: a-proteobacteria)]|nr:enoyl-CoA hydratase/isomerase family protein [Paracoccus sp. (in: a-proteobacteria)]
MIRTERVENGRLARVILDRPQRANALTEAMLRQLAAELDALADDAVHAVVLTGTGKTFSAGADLDEAAAGLAQSDAWAALSTRMSTMPCLTIAALNGTLAGGAFGMVLACDIRIGVPEAEFFYPVMKLGYQPPQGDPERMVRLIGPARTAMILVAGARISAHDALSWGLLDRITDRQALDAEAIRLARPCLDGKAGHIAALKRRLAPDQSPRLL